MKLTLPRSARMLLYFLLPENEVDSVTYTFSRLYKEFYREKGKTRAFLLIYLEIFRSIPGFIHSNLKSDLAMSRSYFKLAWRNLVGNKISSAINILGLAVSISISLVLFLMLIDKYDKDTFHEKSDRIFTIYSSFETGSEREIDGRTPALLANEIAVDLPQIEKTVRIDAEYRRSIMYENIKFEADVFKADESFFELFDFPLISGTRNALESKDAIIISENLANKIFGDDDPINKQLIFSYPDDSETGNTRYFSRTMINTHSIPFTIKGVLKDHKNNTGLNFDCIIPFDNIADRSRQINIDWNTLTSTTFVLLRDKSDAQFVNAGLQKYIDISNSALPTDSDRKIVGFELDNLVNMAVNPAEIRFRFSNSDMPPLLSAILTFAAFLILAIPSFNFINIAIANADKRLREIGIRKVVGANISQLRKQFLTENIFLSIIAIVLGIIICDWLILPIWYDLTIGFSRNYILSTYIFNYRLWLIIISILLFTGISAGGYPAFYVSRFKPVNILRKNQKVKSRKRVTKVLIGTQFIITFCLLAFTVVLGMQADYLKNMDAGYDSDNVYTLYVKDFKRYSKIANELKKNPNVLKISGTRNHIGLSANRGQLEVQGEDRAIFSFDIGKNYLNTIDLKTVNGSGFNENLYSSNDIMVNEAFVRRYAENVKGNTLIFNDETYNIVGTVKDFLFMRVTDTEIEPVLIRLIPEEQYTTVVFKIKENSEKQVFSFVMDSWENLFPGEASNEILVQLTLAQESLSDFDIVIRLYRFLGIMVLAISCVGLFGLVSLQVTRRKKEISIHKVMGSSNRQLVFMLNKEYLMIIGISLLIGTGISYYAMKVHLLRMFAYHFDLTLVPFLLIALSILAIASTTVFHHVFRAATANPVDALRDE